ncbi:hypothetical protein N7532_004298 [Penicillium argentinense]|uniref:Leucine Rich Repeat domain protein n=1 Tax=Penicillium argentinense TaxID=1131581 RepID=A0A9W9KES9_9EURO|nr:uncharacterized protein N7532_004298 [Penicillium argentinense]KAJ5103769.1 hypothetical protein N7532_004298 [Penicillium argentinense]
MDNEVPLPPPRRLQLRSPAGAGRSPSGSVASSFRKARRLSRFDDRSSQPSSDQPLFSSDDIPASGLENYNAPVSSSGRKRRYRGTWWGEQVQDPKRKRADFKEKRNVDSGVWMGSDESGADSNLASEDSPAWGEDLLKAVLDPRAPGKSSGESSNERGPVPVHTQSRSIAVNGQEESKEHHFARKVVNDCLEKGEESIDLGNMNMRIVPRDILQSLQHLTKLPSVLEPPISENAYFSLRPFLRIYLPNNSLTTLPRELFELSDLRVLSLRNNKLTSIPPTIRDLTGLQVLNLSVNRLNYLPWELLGLLQKDELKHFTPRPNPFPSIEEASIAEWHRQPNEDEKEKEKEKEQDEEDYDDTCELEVHELPILFTEYEGAPPEDAWGVIHVATGPTTFYNMDGKPIDDASSSSGSTTATQKLPGLDLITDEEKREFPSLLIPLLDLAQGVRADGGWYCSVCQREFVSRRTEWVEWWDCTPHENGMKRPRASGEKLRPLPFKRYGCSWTCVPTSQRAE